MLRSIDCNQQDRQFCLSVLQKYPDSIAETMTKEYGYLLSKKSRRTANLNLIDKSDLLAELNKKCVTGVYSSADSLKAWAQTCADRCAVMIAKNHDIQDIKNYITGSGVTPPLLNKDKSNLTGFINRIKSDEWWTKKLRRKQSQLQEEYSIKSGYVKRKLSPYISKEAFNNYLASQEKSLEFLQGHKVVNKKTGEEIPLEQIYQSSLANTEHRRTELMIRAGALEHCADNLEHEADFLTLTCPSQYHRYTTTNKKTYKNKEYKGFTPKEGQDYLTGAWSRVRAAMDYAGIKVYGVRVAEPHHDGCPHWHMLLWGSRNDLNLAYWIITAELMQSDWTNKNRWKRGVDRETIDRSRGSAVGYIAKYISKNLDGKTADGGNIGRDFETGQSATNTAVRVRAWSSLWGIRQFQFFGSIPAGLWRELRRLDKAVDNEFIEQLRLLADNGKKQDYGQIVELIGGVMARKDELKIAVQKEPRSGQDKWGEPLTPVVVGIQHAEQGEAIDNALMSLQEAIKTSCTKTYSQSVNDLKKYIFISRPDEWEIKRIEENQEHENALNNAPRASRIHLNNCRDTQNLNESDYIEKPPPEI